MKIWGRGPAGAKALRQDGNARQEGRRKEPKSGVMERASVCPSACHPLGPTTRRGQSCPVLPGLEETRSTWTV